MWSHGNENDAVGTRDQAASLISLTYSNRPINNVVTCIRDAQLFLK